MRQTNVAWIGTVLVLLSVVIGTGRAEKSYTSCTLLPSGIGSLSNKTCCLNLSFLEDCNANARIDIKSGTPVRTQTILRSQIDLQWTRRMCVDSSGCQICFDLNDFAVVDDTASSCPSLSLGACTTLQNYQLPCFSLSDPIFSSCDSCGWCSGNGECVEGKCECYEGYEGFDCGELTDQVFYNHLCNDLPDPIPFDQICSTSYIADCTLSFTIDLDDTELVSQDVDLTDPRGDAGNPIDFLGGDKLCRHIAVDCFSCLSLTNPTSRLSDSDNPIELISGCFSFSLDQCLLFPFNISLPVQCFSDVPYDLCQSDSCEECVHGRCRSGGECLCFKGWSGSSCTIQECKDNCNNRGECKDGVCECEGGYSGDSCEDGEDRTCDQPSQGSLNLVPDHLYRHEVVSKNSTWEAWILVDSTAADFWLKLSSPQISSSSSFDGEDQTPELSVEVRQQCLTSAQEVPYYQEWRLDELSEKESVVDVFSHCDFVSLDSHQLWFISIRCLSPDHDTCAFSFLAHVNLVYEIKPDIQYSGFTQPALDSGTYVSFTLPFSGFFNFQFKLTTPLERVEPSWVEGKDSVRIVGSKEVCPGSTFDFDQEVFEDEPVWTQRDEAQGILVAFYEFTYNSTGPMLWILSVETAPQLAESTLWLKLATGAVCDPPCLNGGVCSKDFADTCLCQRTGHSGERCEVPLCSSNCGGRGVCVAPDVCVCSAPWGGPFCVDLIHSLSEGDNGDGDNGDGDNGDGEGSSPGQAKGTHSDLVLILVASVGAFLLAFVVISFVLYHLYWQKKRIAPPSSSSF